MGQDMTKGNPLQLIIQFSLPMLLGNVFQQFYSIADTYIVSQTMGVEAFSAVGATGSINFFVLGLAIGLTAGLSVITAQHFGKKDFVALRRNLTSSLYISAAISILLTLFATLYTRQILEFMNTPANLIDNAYAYLVVIFAGTGAAVLFNLLSNVLRAIGDSKTPLIFLAITSVLNIVLDYVFILGLNTGMTGVGLATVISQLVASLLCLIYIWKKVPVLRIHKEEWKVTRKEINHHLKIGLPMGFQSSIIAIGSMMIQTTLNNLGSVAVAATTAAEKINGIATMPLHSFGITMATYAAQNYGAGLYDRIWDGVKKISALVVAYSIVVGGLLLVFGRQFAALFVGNGNQAILDYVHVYFLTNATFYIFLALLFIYRYTLQGLGNSTAPMAAGLMELLSRILGAVILAQSFGFAGVSVSNSLAWLGALVPLFISYFSMKNRLVKGEEVQTEREFSFGNVFSKFIPKLAR